jgi:ABC-2 type transport system permease protein
MSLPLTDVVPARSPTSPGAWRTAVLCAGRDLRLLSRSPITTIQTIVFPTLLLLTLLAAFGRMVGGSVDVYADRLVPQLVISAGAFGAVGTGLTAYADRTGGMLDRLRTLPLPQSSYLVGLVAADATRALTAAVFLVAVGQFPGFRFEEGPLAALGFLALATVFGTTWAWLALHVGLGAEQTDSIGGLMNGPVLILFFLSTGFVPIEGFPGAIQPIVRANPLSCAVNALVGLSSGGPILVPTIQALAWTAGLTAVLATAATRRYRTST